MTDPESRPEEERAGEAARLTPYELVFSDDQWEARLFPQLQEEAEAHGLDPLQRARFAFLSRGGEALREIAPEDVAPEALEDYHLLLYHAFNFWRFGKRVYLFEPAVARHLVEASPPLTDWEFTYPYPSLYLQFPANLFWSRISADSTPEPVDGFFVTTAPAPPVAGVECELLEALMVLGIRRERLGFSVIPFDAEVVPRLPAQWAAVAGREGDADFANILPGGELSRLYSVLTTTEALKLVARALWFLDRHPENILLRPAPERRVAERPRSARWSRLPHYRVSPAIQEESQEQAPGESGA